MKYIIREIAPENAVFEPYFDDDGLTEKGGDYCYHLFIVCNGSYNRLNGFNIEEYKKIRARAENIINGFSDVEEGYISSYDVVEEGVQGKIVITLKYGPNGEKVITGLKRVSKPGLRIYASCEDLPKVLGGLGIAIISTSKGVMTDKQARKIGHGGEVVAYVW